MTLPHNPSVFHDILAHESVCAGRARLTEALEGAFRGAGLTLKPQPRTTLVEPRRITGVSWWDVQGHSAGSGSLCLELSMRLDDRAALAVHLLLYARAPEAREAHGLFDIMVAYVPALEGWAPADGLEPVIERIRESELLQREDWHPAAAVVAGSALQALEP